MATNTGCYAAGGVGEYAEIAAAAQTGLAITGNMTVALWANTSALVLSTGADFSWLSNRDATGGFQIYTRWAGIGNPVAINVRAVGPEGTDTLTGGSLASFRTYSANTDHGFPESFNHYAFVFDFSSGTLVLKKYYNGDLWETDNGTITSLGVSAAALTIGASPGGTNQTSTSAKFDELKIWDAALPQELIKETMRENLHQTALKAYWNFNEQLWDQVNGNDFTAVGVAEAELFEVDRPFVTYGRTTEFQSTGGDGDVGNTDTGWSTTRGAATGDAVDVSGNTVEAESSKPFQSSNRTIKRAFFPFDTSGMDSGASVLDAYLVFGSGSGGDELVLVQTSQADTSTLTTADFDQCGNLNTPNEGMDRVTSGSSRYLRLDSTGRGWIDPTGVTKLGIRTVKDVDDTDFSGTSAQSEGGDFESSRNTGTIDDPLLIIVDDLESQDILSDATEPVGGSGGDPRDPGGSGIPGYTPGMGGTNPGGSSAGETALFFFAWLDS